MRRRWKPSKEQAREFAKKMDEINDYCNENNIHHSANSDSYYFQVNGKNYRVSNHTVEASNRHAYNWAGEKVREEYHPNGREDDVIYIHASKTRLIEIHKALLAGKELDGRGFEKSS